MKTTNGRVRIALPILVLGLLSGAVVAPTAEASSIAWTRVSRTSPSTSATKSVTATCPAGLDLIGTGGRVTNGDGEVVVTDIVPNSALTSVRVTAAENGGFPGSWQVTAVAVCTSEASSLTRVSASSEDDGTSVSPKDASVSCSGGEVALGMGYRLTGANGNVFPNLLTPVGSPPDMAVVSAFEDLDYAPTWDLEVYAICGDVPGDVVVEQASNGPDSVSPKQATATCDAGMTAVSAGGNNGGQVSGHADDLILERMTPDPGLDGVTVRVAENLGLGTDWTMTAYAICVG
jgi:hypothetical protein